ncbi:MAG TPA: TetR/AcrR family transcriptional regulator [Methylomirabilota bacterium]|nr:TetR/AcrR family transcriptional regulator [Methylomirabilota bacterium]
MATKAESQKAKILDAFLARLATTRLGKIELADVAADAGVSLADLRAAYDSRLAMLEAFTRRIDLETLAKDDPAMADQPGRDRLFDVVMARLDALAPYREAVRMLDRSVRRDPVLALAVAGGAVRSMAFMLASARIPTGGAMGRLRAQGLALAFSRIVPVWLDDADPGLARTLVAVDKELGRCAEADRMATRLCGFVGRMCSGARRRREPDAGAPGTAGEGI